jgi:hypothetical protein
MSAEEQYYTDRWLEAHDAIDALNEQMDRTLYLKVEALASELASAAIFKAHARLCRLRPDLFAFALWPEMMPVPEWLTRSGKPFEMCEPLSVRQE